MDGKDYDLVVIGGGPAGIAGAATAARFGKSVALVDDHRELGGAGINTGTAPSKTLRETALALSGARSRNLYGVDLSLRKEATVADFLRHERNVKTGLNTFVMEMLERSKIDVHYGTAIFVDDHTVTVRSSKDGPETRLRGEVILVATGSSPVRPAIFPFDSSGVYDSDTILELVRLPKTLAVIGAGVIGSEYASTFSALGTQVQLIDSRSVLLPFLDSEISRSLAAAMEGNGIVFHWDERVVACVSEPAGIVLTLSSGLSLTVEAVLVAVRQKKQHGYFESCRCRHSSRRARTHRCGRSLSNGCATCLCRGRCDWLSRVGIHKHGTGAARDPLCLRAQAPVRVSRRSPHRGLHHPRGRYGGETEQSLQQKGVPYVVGRRSYNATVRGRIVGDTHGFLKLIFQRGDMRLLGVHALGEQATELVHIGMVAMLGSSTSEIFAEACFNTPTFGELYKFAAIDAERAAAEDRGADTFYGECGEHAARD